MAIRDIVLICGCMVLVSCTASSSSRPVRATHAMVVCADKRATDVGVQILKSGGNAVDAAVAVGFALSVVFPEAGNIGGGGFMVVRMADGRESMIDFREKAPGSATKNMYLDSVGNPTQNSFEGHLSSGVPGTVAGLLKALELYGTQKRNTVMQPAVKLAEQGLLVNERLAGTLAENRVKLLAFPSTRKYLAHDTLMPVEGDRIPLRDLASSLRRIQKEGASGFYRGLTARMIVDEMKRGGGIVSMEDLAQYEPVLRKPLHSTYRGYEIVTAPPPSSGGLCLIEALNILEGCRLDTLGYHSARSVHYIVEAMKRMHADRSKLMGDADFVTVPIKELISKEYGTERRNEINPVKATPIAEIHAGPFYDPDEDHTTHFSIIDEQGNAVAVTYTLNDTFGSKVMVAGAGFFLNDEMDDFVSKPGTPNVYGLIGGDANAIAAHKRPLSSMTPTIMVKDGHPVLIAGARGGPRIISAVLQTIIDVVDYGMNIQEAVDLPRFHHQWLPDTLRYEQFALSKETVGALMAAGYTCAEVSIPIVGGLECIYIDPVTGYRYGGADPREGGTAGGY